MLGYFCYLNMYRKLEIINWMARKMFSDRATNQSVGREMAENLGKKSAENVFMVVSSFLFTVGGLWVILAFYYLSY